MSFSTANNLDPNHPAGVEHHDAHHGDHHDDHHGHHVEKADPDHKFIAPLDKRFLILNQLRI